DPAAPRRDGDQLNSVTFRKQLIFLVLRDRQPAHATNQQPPDRRLRASKQHHPPREGDRLMGRRDPHVLHRPSLQASMRETIHAHKGKTQIEMITGGAIWLSGGLASSSLATRHCSHSSVAISTAASTHSVR